MDIRVIPENPDWGFDPQDFWGLAGRLVPCGPAHLMVAVDLKHRLLWWDSEDGLWRFIPKEEHERRFSEIDAWRAVAPSAIDALVTFLKAKKNDFEAERQFTRFMAIQDTFMRAQHLACAWQGGWLYRSLLLDHRWLLHGFSLMTFDEFIFSVMAGHHWGGLPDQETVRWLQRDPLIAAMPALYEYVYPESWKTGVMLTLRERGIQAVLDDVDQALDRMATRGCFSAGQVAGLRSHHGCLHGEAGATTQADVMAEIALVHFSAPKAERNYIPFTLPLMDKALSVCATLPSQVTHEG